MTVCLVSCFTSHLKEARCITKKFPREYTEIDTLIRIDGYYYMEDSTGLSLPFFFSKNGEFKKFIFGKLKTQEELQRVISSFVSYNRNYTILGDTMFESRNGKYILLNDTIKAEWASAYYWGCYTIYADKYLIINDTTLQHIWRYRKHVDEITEEEKNDIYHFYEYKFDAE
jgi:hypothetical protein